MLSWGNTQAQLITSPSFHENTLVNNPASVGALQHEQIQMSTFNHFSEALNSGLLIKNQIKRFSSLSYHNTQSLPIKLKVTLGLQMQLNSNPDNFFYTLNTYGVSTNLHFPLAGNDTKERYFSLGMQMNLIHQKPKRAVTTSLFENLLESSLSDYDSFHKQFSKTGFQYTFNLSYLKHKYKKSIFGLGFSLGAVESKLARSSNTSGSYRFESDVNVTGLLYLNFQQALGRKFMLDFNILYSIFSQLDTSFGLSFKLKNDKVIRITANRRELDFDTNSGGTIGYEMNRFSYYFHFSARQQRDRGIFTNIAIFTTTLNRSTFVELGVKYNMSSDFKPSLLNLKY